MRWLVLAAVACSAPRAPRTPAPDADTLGRAVWRGDLAAVRDQLAHGADPDAEDNLGRTAIVWAITARDDAMLDLLLEHAPHLSDRLITRAMLRMAAGLDDAATVDKLLARGVPVDAAVDKRASPLLVAAENGALAAMKRLLAAHADARFTDPEGDTPLAAAARAGCTRCVDLLLASGADVAHRDAAGRSAVTWARWTEQPELAERLLRAGAPDVPAPARGPVPAPDLAIARAVPMLQRANASWQADGECTSCHHLPMAVRAITLVEQKGFPVDVAVARAAVAAIHQDDDKYAAMAPAAFAKPDGVLELSMQPAGDAAFGDAWFLAAELGAGLPAGPSQRVLTTWLARMQQPDGHWRVGPMRGVIEWSELESTALAIEVIAGYGDDEAKRALPAAASWLDRQQPFVDTVVDSVARLRADKALGAPTDAATLRAAQHADGSWGHNSLYGPGDAYSTGLAAVALIEAGGVDPHDPTITRAVAYLLRTQEPDGTWLVPSRAPPLLPYHDRGFPHGKLQFVSFAGTAWATMAIAYASAR